MIHPIEYQRRTPAFPGQIMPGTAGYRVCKRCVMDTTHVEIDFNEDGVCNFCRGFDTLIADRRPSDKELASRLEKYIDLIKSAGVGRSHDCVLGVSGGVDSSYLALKCKDWGLRPLLVQFDNGWNTELATHNIEKLCDRLGFDLYTHVVDWREFSSLQLAFLKAGVANLEIPSDHGIFACIYQTARSQGIRWLLSGVNQSTEACVPLGKNGPKRLSSYGYRYSDLVHLKAVHKKFHGKKFETFPTMGFVAREWLERTGKICRFDPLNYINYVKCDAVATLQRDIGWKPYPGKHFESIVTRFHQSYILPVKFGVDKRKLHLSGLIWSGQHTREAAIAELSAPPCSAELLAHDREFFIKKLGLSDAEFCAIMAEQSKSSLDYPNIDWVYTLNMKLYATAAKIARTLLLR